LTRALVALLVLAACSDEPEEVPEPEPAPPADPTRQSLVGRWRVVLDSPGGELPFGLEIHEEGHDPPAEILNGDESARVDRLVLEGHRLAMHFDVYRATLIGELDESGTRLRGSWSRPTRHSTTGLDMTAVKGRRYRFAPIREDAVEGAPERITGTYRTVFTHDEETHLAQGELIQHGDRLFGTFLTETGDYRYLEGTYDRGHLRLSTFNGFSAYLFHAEVGDDGEMNGDWWSADRYHATWVAEPHDLEEAGAILGDAYTRTRVVTDDRSLSFTCQDLEGHDVAFPGERFAGKPAVIDVFGTWCPNCNDLAPLLARWHHLYEERGLQVVGLAFEYTEELEEAKPMLQAYQRQYGLEFPLLFCGRVSRDRAAEVLSDLSGIRAYPTTIFVDREGHVQQIHSGFAGPATMEHHEELVRELDAHVAALL